VELRGAEHLTSNEGKKRVEARGEWARGAGREMQNNP